MGRIKTRGNGEGEPYPVRQDGKVIGYAFTLYFTVDGVRKSKKIELRATKQRTLAQTRSEVKAKAAAVRERFDKGEDVSAKPLTVSDFLTEWIAFIAKKGKANKTIDTYEWAISKINLHIGTIPLPKVTTRRLDRLFIELGEGANPLAPSSIRRVRSVLRNAFKQAKKWKRCTENPVNDTDPLPMPPKRAKRLTIAQANAIAAAARTERLGLAVVLALVLGLRRGEVAGLRWEDIDFPRGTLTVNGAIAYTPKHGKYYKSPKTESGKRVIGLSQPVLRALVAHRTRQDDERETMEHRWKPDTGFMFVSERTGEMLNPGQVYKVFKNLCTHVGITGFRLHDTRHTVASDLVEQGIDPNTVAALLGHSSSQITKEVYIHSSPKQIADAAANRAFLLELPIRVESPENAE